MALRIVTAYTPDYAEMAARLVASAAYFNVPVTSIPFASRGDWKRNCAVKPEMILRAMTETGDDCLWLDADMYLRAWPSEWPAGDVLLKYSDPPEPTVFDFNLARNVPNQLTLLTPWGGHILFRHNPNVIGLLTFWRDTCLEYGTLTNDEQCLMHQLGYLEWVNQPVTIGPLDPYFIVHTPEGHRHGKPTAAEGWI